MQDRQWYAILIIDHIMDPNRVWLTLSQNRRPRWVEVSLSDQMRQFLAGTASHLGDYPFDVVGDTVKYWEADPPGTEFGLDDDERVDMPPRLAEEMLSTVRLLMVLGPEVWK